MAEAAAPGIPVGAHIGRYRVRGVIGRGGAATVYAVEDTHRGGTWALKALRHPAKASRIERFRREYAWLSRFSHAAIPSVRGYGIHDGLPYYVTEIMEGGRLRDRFARPAGQPVDVLDLVDQAWQACQALAYIHERGVVHRDVKPDNLLIDGRWRCRLVDFGLAVDLSQPQPARVQRLHGTLSYASPEQARGLPVDHRADLYGLGITLFELACGRRPFVADSLQGLLRQHIHAAPTSPRRLAPELPPSLSELILALMEKRPWDRPRDAREVAQTLEGVLVEVDWGGIPHAQSA